MSTTFPIKGDADKKIGAFFAPLSVSAQDAPALTVKIRAGSFINSQNAFVEYAGGNSPTIAAPTTAARWTVIGLTDSGTVSITHGTTAGAPSIPDITSGILPLAAIFMSSTTTSITSAQIQDIRPFIRSIDNVPNLTAQLNDRPTATDVNNNLATKADVDGTPNSVFALNKDFLAGTPIDVVDLTVKRGSLPDVAIRWNETADVWEFTNDGITFSPFVSSVGTFALVGHTHVPADITNFNATVDARIATSVFPQSQVTNLVTDLASKASASVVTAHTSDATIHFTLPIAQSNVTGLTAALAGKVDVAAPGTLTGNLTVQTAGNQPIQLVSSDTGSSGLVVDRSAVPGPNARFEWDETSQAWLIGTTTSMNTVLTNAIIATKADKVVGAVTGHFAALDVNGNLTDSGFNSANFQVADADLTAIAALTGTSGFLTTNGAGVWTVDTTTYQPVDTDLTAIAALTGTSGFLTTNGAGVWTVDTTTYQPAGSYQPLDADLTAIAALTGTSGLLTTDGAGIWSVTSASTYQPADADLTAIAGLTPVEGQVLVRGASAWVNSTQYKVFEGTVQTTDATATLIKAVAVAANKATTFTVLAHGFQSAGSAGTVGDTYSVTLDGTLKNVAGTTALVGAVGSVARNDAGAATWTIVATANDTSDTLDITVTGEVNKTIDWFVTIQLNVG